MQALQNIAVINGRPSLWGDAMLALVQSHPEYDGHKEYIKDDVAYCEVKIKGCDLHVSTFSKEDAILAGLWGKSTVWKSYPERMLKLRARGFALRDHAYMIADLELIEASKKGHTQIAKLLIHNGADVNVASMGGTALIWASYKGHTETAKLLIDKGADVNAVDKYGDTALTDASYNGHTETAKLLIDNGADVNAADRTGETALMNAYKRGHLEVIELLIDSGAKE